MTLTNDSMKALVEKVARAICGADHPNFKDGGHPGPDEWDREEAEVAIRAVLEHYGDPANMPDDIAAAMKAELEELK